MSTQRPLFPDQQIPSPESAASHVPADAPAPVWLQRLSLAVLVLFCVYIGALMVVLPWMPRYWDQNTWLLGHPALRGVLQQGWARGVLSGFGLLDIWIGLSEAFHYRDYRPHAATSSGSSDV